MRRFHLVILLLLFLYFINGCQEPPEKPWIAAVPQKTAAVIIPPENTTLSKSLEAAYIPFLDDITMSAIQLVSEADSYPDTQLSLKALLLYPGAMDQLQPVWLAEAPTGFIEKLNLAFKKKFTQNTYFFHGQVIHKLFIRDHILFASQVNNLLLLTESSLALEDAIRSYYDLLTVIDNKRLDLTPSTLIINTPSLDYWIEKVAKVEYRPKINGMFSGMGPASVKVNSTTENGSITDLYFHGTIPLTDNSMSELTAATTSHNAPITLDRYISSNAAAFALFRLMPRLAPPTSVPDSTRLDSLLISEKDRYLRIAETVDKEFALVMYAESGFLSTGEHLFLRKLKDRSGFIREMNRLVSNGFAEKRDNTYLLRGQVLAKLIGSELSDFHDYYLDITGNVAVISKRKGLAELISSDRSRRRVIYYEQNYLSARNSFPDSVSSLFVANNEFYDFISPFLDQNNNINAFTTKFDLLTLSLQKNENEKELAFDLRTYKTKVSDRPYREKWLFPTDGGELTGKPVLGDIRGSSRNEIIFSTSNGRIYALATDGTIVMQNNTGNDKPVGSPIIFDWYGTNQKVIIQAAGNKIYGWNDTGAPLPKFPFELPEKISAPPLIEDLDRDGLPNVIVATDDRRIHVLDGRGDNITGWPVAINAPVTARPLVGNYRGALSVIAFSANTIHTWYPDGISHDDFPVFISTALVGEPVLHDNNILGGAADGNLYSIGKNRIFADSLNLYNNISDTLDYEAVYVSNSSLAGTPSVRNLTVQAGDETYSGKMILTMSTNGSTFLLSEEGQLRFTRSMGQPSAQDFSPFITDINGDGVNEIITLGSFGRLYAWQLNDGERLYSLPTSGMSYPIVTDIDGDGNNELIARTREGLRAWTIYDIQQ